MDIVDIETAYAKVNLALHVRARRADGYHDLETLFAFVDDGDEVAVAAGDGLSLTISGPFAAGLDAGRDNLVLRAALTLQNHPSFRRRPESMKARDDQAALDSGLRRNDEVGGANGIALHLTKNLPVASGIGGGSADAAATLRLLNRYWQLGLTTSELCAIAAPLGADVAACIASQTCIGTGVGDQLSPVDGRDFTGTPILLVNPNQPLATGPVFAAWDQVDRGPLAAGDPVQAMLAGRNDLQEPALQLCPVIADVLVALRDTGAFLVRMSGSGATCFALYPDDDVMAAAHAKMVDLRPHWWTMAGNLR